MNRSAGPFNPFKDHSRVHRLCQGQSRQTQHGVGRQRIDSPFVGDRFKVMTGVNLVHVPYRGAGTALRWR
jgi:hypothetical protein